MAAAVNCIRTKHYLIAALLAAVATLLLVPRYNNNVCKTFEDYYSDRDSNENCYQNPADTLTVPEIVERNGYPIETYEVMTMDGYILTIFRIPHGKHFSSKVTGRRVVFLHHGCNGNSGIFVSLGSKSLAYILADEGYDVWLANARGSRYSLGHETLDHSSNPAYWNFSIDQHGKFDLYAQINFINSKTNQKMIYIGYSLGNMIMYIYNSLYAELASDRIDLFVNIAPVAFVGEEYFTVPKFASLFWDYVEVFLRYFTNGDVPTPFVVPKAVLRYLCLPYPFQMKFCMLGHRLVVGSRSINTDPETLPITLVHNLDKSSLKLWTHMSQLWYTRTFKPYDYGEKGNIELYGSKSPPTYNLSKVEVPLYFIRAESDLLTTEKDTIKLLNALPSHNRPQEDIIGDWYGHYDLITAKTVVPMVHNRIIKMLKTIT